jgi:glycosyltransferase involved in cell wall biosynthesis
MVSVITIFLNAERFLEEAVESVFAQTFPHWELLLVDDGSTDSSTEYARRYAADHPGRVRYLEHPRHENRGTSASRNLGIAHARGTYIAFLDSDDVWLAPKLAEQVALLESHPGAVMVFGSPVYWRSWTGNPGDAGADSMPGLWTEPNVVIPPPRLLTLSYPLGRGGAPCPSDLCLRREFVERIGGFEEDFHGIRQLFEDQAFLAKVYLEGPVVVSDRCWSRYRIHPESCVAVVTRDGHYHTVRHYYLRWLKRYLRAAGVRDREIHRALRRGLQPYAPPWRQWITRQISAARSYMGALRVREAWRGR